MPLIFLKPSTPLTESDRPLQRLALSIKQMVGDSCRPHFLRAFLRRNRWMLLNMPLAFQYLHCYIRISSADNIRATVSIGNHCAKGRIWPREYELGRVSFCISSKPGKIWPKLSVPSRESSGCEWRNYYIFFSNSCIMCKYIKIKAINHKRYFNIHIVCL